MTRLDDFSALGAALRDNPHRAVVLADARGNIAFWNAGCEALFGWAAAEAEGHRVDLVVPHELREMHWAGFNRTIGSTWPGADSWGPIEALHKSGSLVPLEVLLTPMFGPDGRVAAVMGMFRRPVAA